MATRKAASSKAARKSATAKRPAQKKTVAKKTATNKTAAKKPAAKKEAGGKKRVAKKTAAGKLARYQEMRDFDRTKEPAGTPGRSPNGDLFVVQRHRARRRHYDLRLELDGVLLSWAVPKGPTLDAKARHLAVRVEDHPMEYAAFEGIIPAGEYGGGDVIVWDTGTWAPEGDPKAALEAGNLHFDLAGSKLKGRFVLVRRGAKRAEKEQWLLLHKNDEFAQPGWDAEDHPASVKSGRTNDQVAAEPAAMWRSGVPADQAEVAIRKTPEKGRTKKWKAPAKPELKALADLGKNGKWEIAGQELSLSNLDKVIFPKTKETPAITKRELIHYYATIAPTMLPYLASRPLNMNRYPNGVHKQGFWQKEAPDHTPSWLTTWDNPDASPGKAETYLMIDSVPALAWLANLAAIELHAWTSKAPDVEHPTWVLFDIDPGPKTTFDEVMLLARLHRTAFEHLGLEARPKVTGQRGIQIWLPVTPQYTYAETREWAKQLSEAIGATVPELVSWAWRKNERHGLARLDYTQNVINKTLVAPYSLRPHPGAPVSVPITWDELDDPQLRSDRWTISDITDRVRDVGDPFAELIGLEQELPPW